MKYHVSQSLAICVHLITMPASVLVKIEEIGCAKLTSGCAKCRRDDRACLARGVRGHVSPENFENKGVKWCTLGGFWGHLNRKTVTQIPEFSGLYLYFIIQL